MLQMLNSTTSSYYLKNIMLAKSASQAVWMGWHFVVVWLFFSLHLHLPAEEFHEVLEAVLSEEVEGALRRAQVDEQEDYEDNGQEGDEQVPASCQDVVPLGLVWTLLGQLQVALCLLISGLQTQTHMNSYLHLLTQFFTTMLDQLKLLHIQLNISKGKMCMRNIIAAFTPLFTTVNSKANRDTL